MAASVRRFQRRTERRVFISWRGARSRVGCPRVGSLGVRVFHVRTRVSRRGTRRDRIFGAFDSRKHGETSCDRHGHRLGAREGRGQSHPGVSFNV